MSPATGPGWLGQPLQRKGLHVEFERCGERHESRVATPRSRFLTRARRRAGRPAWRRSVWRCGRPLRHEGPCAPAARPTDATDVLLARWKARR